MLQSNGPLLIAANHPNSFLDAVILATLFNQPIYSLARGDVFINKFYNKIWASLKILPVFRISEGAENLGQNYKTFDDCKEIFKRNGIVLIFSESSCSNEWHLRPLKKGTARLAISCWEDGIPLKVLPVGINYSSFRSFGKTIRLNLGKSISKEDIDTDNSFGKNVSSFNTLLQSQLQELVIEINTNDEASIKKEFSVYTSPLKKALLFIPSKLGWLFHAPLYYSIKKIVWGRASHKDHFDSILIGFLFVAYPVYLCVIGLLIYWLIGGWWALAVFLIVPFFAWSCLQLKN